MSGYFEYKFSLTLTATGKTGMELSGTISEFAKDAILSAIMRDDRERICAASIKKTWDESQALKKPLTDEEIIETCDTWVLDDIGNDEVIKIVRRTEFAHGIGDKND